MTRDARKARPVARRADVLTNRIGDDTVVYDLKRHEGHCLNRAASLVWHACDGITSVPAIAARVSRELGEPVDEAFVYFALRRLERARLLQTAVVTSNVPRLSRRALAKRLGFVSALSLLLPTVVSVVAPTAVQAGASSCTQANCIGGLVAEGCCCFNISPKRLCQRSGVSGRFRCDGAVC